ncbi:hypothetical protein [Alteromonas portus]|uniref:hypothetical protein n=1 Tax=Alteromonas portus TaxID=2565549 RepID=UPI003BF8D009
MPDDLVPYFDCDAPNNEGTTLYRDSSAASLVANALLELSTFVESAESERYYDANKSVRLARVVQHLFNSISDN